MNKGVLGSLASSGPSQSRAPAGVLLPLKGSFKGSYKAFKKGFFKGTFRLYELIRCGSMHL